MPKYRVTLEGENFPMIYEGDEACMFGFITTRRVKADSVKNAKEIALNLINNDKTLWDRIDKKLEDKPRVFVSDIVELKWWNRLSGAGYSFYQMNES